MSRVQHYDFPGDVRFFNNKGIHNAFSTTEVQAYPVPERLMSNPAGTTPMDPLPFPGLQGFPVAFWGNDNKFPQDLLKDLSNNTVGRAALDTRKNIHYGKGVRYFHKKIANNKIILEPAIIPEIEDFFLENDISTLQPRLIADLEYLWIANPGFILTRNREKIATVYHNQSAFCRFSTMNPITRRMDWVYRSDYWPMPPPMYVDSLPTFDKANPAKNLNFINPIRYYSPGNIYYPEPSWNSVRNNGWMKYVNKIPRLKNAMVDNQFFLKYHIEVPLQYWKAFCEEKSLKWGSEQANAAIDDKMAQFNEFLSGVDNANKTFFSHFGISENGEPLPGWKINVIDNKVESNQWLPDSAAGDAQIFLAMQLHPSLSGAGLASNSMGAGSGSQTRELYWAHIAKLDADRHLSLSWLDFVCKFNKWGNDIVFDYIDIDTSATVGQNPQTPPPNPMAPVDFDKDKKKVEETN